MRRRIINAAFHAIKIGGLPRRQYRILARDLAAWIGEDAAKAVFGIGHGLDALQTDFADLEPNARASLIDEAQTWARAKTVTPTATDVPWHPKKLAGDSRKMSEQIPRVILDANVLLNAITAPASTILGRLHTRFRHNGICVVFSEALLNIPVKTYRSGLFRNFR